MLIRYSLLVKLENYYQEYKGHTKWLSYLTKKNFFGMTLLHAHAQYICIVYAKYQKASVKALVQVDFPVYAQFKKNKNLQEKMAKFTKLSFCQKLIFWHKNSSCKCSMCLYYVGKVSDSFNQNSGTS